MITRLVQWSLQQRGLVLLGSALALLLGVWAWQSTPVDAIPDLSETQVIIRATWTGQAPEVVEQQLTYPLTSALLGVPGARTVRGYSFFGDAYVYVIFDDHTDLYWARSRVLESLSQVQSQLPPEAQTQLGPDATGVGWVYEYALVDRSGGHDLHQLTTLQNWTLRYALQAVPGVAEVATVGGMVQQYQVQVDPLRLQAYNLELETVIRALGQASAETGAGVLEMAEAEYMLRIPGYATSIEDLEAIALRASASGAQLRLADVATVQLGPALRRGVAELNGEGEVVGGIIVMRAGANAQQVIAGVKQRLQDLEASLPEGLEIVTTYDRSGLIAAAVQTLERTLVKELLLVCFICALFLLHLPSAFVALLVLPLGVLLAYVLMRLGGISANIMSLGGIAIAIGAMVDGAMVMLENLHRHLESEDERSHWQRVQDAAQEVAPALFVSLCIITLSFVPVLSLGGQEGKLFAPLAWTKTFAMAAAALLAVTLVPVLMGLIVRGRPPKAAANPLNRWSASLYQPLLQWSVRHPRSVVFASALLALTALWPASQLGREFMPPLDEGDWMYMPTTRPGISVGKARELLQQTNRLIASVPEVETAFGKVGRAQTATDPAPLTMIETTIRFKPPEQWRDGLSLEDIRQDIRERVQVPGLSPAWVMPIRTRIDMLSTGVKTSLGLRISGPELKTIQSLGRQAEEILAALPQTASAYAEQVVGGRYVDIRPDRDALARFGLSMGQAQQLIRAAVGGVIVGQSVQGRERFPIQLRYPAHWRENPQALGELPLRTPLGQNIRLQQLAQIELRSGAPMIKSENARLGGWVLIEPRGSDIAGYVRTAQTALQRQLDLPSGYSMDWVGQYQSLQSAQRRLSLVIPLTLVLIAALLYALFRRATPVVVLLATLPVAAAGGVWLLWWLDYALSVAVAVGLIALAGVAIEIGVVMWTYLENDQRQAPQATSAAELNRLITHAAQRRLRPVLMTGLATIAGLLPIMVSSGTGAEVMQRIAAPMVGGMASTMLLVLVVLPAVFAWLAPRPN
nr:efflux RND transporter permease subunit [Oceanococcus sp. HetDA_MAG_MS8]